MDFFAQDNPYQITLSTGEGFHPSKEEMQRLEAIDRRLKALMPPQEYASIASTPTVVTPVLQVSGYFINVTPVLKTSKGLLH